MPVYPERPFPERQLNPERGTREATGLMLRLPALSRTEEVAAAIGALDREFPYARLAVHELIQAPALMDEPENLGTLRASDHRHLFAGRSSGRQPSHRPTGRCSKP